MAEMNERQKIFCREYIVDFNMTQAAIRAGYSAKTAGAIGSRLLKDVDIQAEVRKAIKERNEITGVTAERVIHELAKIAFSNVKDVVKWNDSGTYVTLKNMEEVDGALIGEIGNTENGVKVKLHDKMKALEALAKHTGVYDDRPTTTVDVTPFVTALKESAGKVWAKGEDDGEN